MQITKNSQAFTLTEILISVLIMGILAGMAIPSFRTAVEQSRSNEARAAINIIYSAEKIYLLNTARCWPNPDSTTTCLVSGGVPAAINTGLSVDLPAMAYYNLSVTSTSATFTATATRTTGSSPKTFTINQAGTQSEGGSYP